MLKVLICGQQSERILEASRFFRMRDIEVYFMPYPILEQLEADLKDGVTGILICDNGQEEMWKHWLHRNKCSLIIMH
jgi:hypothetical protein